jgi:hypothetical protein
MENDCFWLARDVSMLEEEVIFLLQEGIQKEGFNNLWKSKMSGGDHILSSPKQYEGFDVDEEINNMMNGIPQDESNGYRCDIFDDSSSDGIVKKGSYSMSEGWDEEGNGKKKHERTNNENRGRNFCILSKGRCAW